MKIRGMNTRMKELYSSDWNFADVLLPTSLDDILRLGVICHGGCYVFRACHEPPLHVNRFRDRTDCESSINHIHLVDHDDDRLPIAFAFLDKVSHRLQEDFPDVEFIGTISSKPNGQECVVRFCSEHPGEPPWFADDLEGYELDAVCVLDLSS